MINLKKHKILIKVERILQFQYISHAPAFLNQLLKAKIFFQTGTGFLFPTLLHREGHWGGGGVEFVIFLRGDSAKVSCRNLEHVASYLLFTGVSRIMNTERVLEMCTFSI
jgi:hypothetical protein